MTFDAFMRDAVISALESIPAHDAEIVAQTRAANPPGTTEELAAWVLL